MLWEGNILFTLRHREIGNWRIPLNAQHKVLRKFMGSDDMTMKTICNLYPRDCPIYYNNRRLYYEDWLQEKELGSSFLIKPLDDLQYIDAILFPLNPNSCICNSKDCLCFKRYCICLNSDQWLLRFDCDTGLVIDEKFVGSDNSRYSYDFCKWTGLEDLYVLKASHGDLDDEGGVRKKCRMSVFNSKLRFKHVFDVEERVFGANYLDADINDQLFFVYVNNHVQIYSFADVLKEGVFVLEDDSLEPDVGQRRILLKINFKITKAPPVLFEVHCFGNPLVFGIDPHHCLIRKTQKTFFIKNLKQNTDGSFDIDEADAERLSDKVIFHPIIPNMVIVQMKMGVHCYKIIDLPDCVQLEEALVLKFPDSYPSSPCVATEESTIFAFTCEVSLGLIGILGYHSKDPWCRGFVKLFDWSSGEEVGSVKVTSFDFRESRECQFRQFSLLVDLDIVVVVEDSYTDDGRNYHLAMYMLSRREHDE